MFPGKRTTKLKNITKLTYQKTGKGYLVRLTWKGQRYKATFMISDYSDWLATLDAAIEWRNKMEIHCTDIVALRRYPDPEDAPPAVEIDPYQLLKEFADRLY